MCNGRQMHAEKGESRSQQEPCDTSANMNTYDKKTTARKMNIKMLV